MDWAGVATLVATACFVLYRFPPRTWAPEPPQPRPESNSEKQTPRPKNTAKARDDEANTRKPEVPEIKPEPDNNNKEEEETPQTTPKASAANSPTSVLEVPVLDLAAVPQPTENGSAKWPEVIPSSHNKPLPQNTPGKVARNESTMMPPPPSPPSPPSQPTAPSQPAAKAESSSLMPPPPLPRQHATGQQQQQVQQSQLLSPGRYAPRPNSNSLRPPPSAAASQRGPGPQQPSSGNSLAPPAQPSLKPPKASASKRAALEPGYSPLDWAALTSNPKNNLRGANLPPTYIRVTPSMLQARNGRKGRDAWTSYQGKVYNISPYLKFHPGGQGELLRGAGKDSATLFLEVHPWVNWDAILGECLVGIMVSENEAEGQNILDSMD